MDKVRNIAAAPLRLRKLAETAVSEHERGHYLQLVLSYRALADRRERQLSSAVERP